MGKEIQTQPSAAKHKTIRGIALLAGFLAGLLVINWILSVSLTTARTVVRYGMHDAYARDAYFDFTLFGASEAMYCLDPEQFDQEMGFTSNCVAGTAVILSCGQYALFEDYLKWRENHGGAPKTMALMIGQYELFGYKNGEDPTSFALLAPYLKYPSSKLDYWNRSSSLDERWFERVFSWKDLIQNDPITNVQERLAEDYRNYRFVADNRYYKGNGFIYRDPSLKGNYDETLTKGIKLKKIKKYDPPKINWTKANQGNVEALKQMAQVCREKGIRFLVVQAPCPYYAVYTANYIRSRTALLELAESEGFEYFDINFARESVYQSEPDGFYNKNHANGLEAAAFTKGFANLLKAHDAGVPDSELYDDWETMCHRIEAWYADNPKIVFK